MLPLICLLLAAPVETGSFRFTPLDDQKDIPDRYRLAAGDFRYELQKVRDLNGIGVSVSHLRYPSPVTSKHPANNTVHAEYYRPQGSGPFPAVIVLDITGGNQMVSRIIASHLARHGVAGLFVQMAYYGPRRPPGSGLKLMTSDIKHTTAAVTQTVLDLRVAAAWLASRPEVDAKRLGITGTSLGSFVSALTGEMEPRLGRVCVLLGGGNFVDGYAGHPLAAPLVAALELVGYSREGVRKLIAPIDPITCAENLKKRKLLILAATKDEVVPSSMARMLWEATGRQKIVWFEAGHYTAALHIAEGLEHVVHHFQQE